MMIHRFMRVLIIMCASFTLSTSTALCPHECKCFINNNGLQEANCTELSDQTTTNWTQQILRVDFKSHIGSYILLKKKPFKYFPQLTYLDIRGGRVPYLENSAFDRLPKLVKLNLIGMGLRKLHRDTFDNNQNLVFLSLRKNPRLFVDNLFLISKSITHLDISECALSILKSVYFKGLLHLKQLVAMENELKVLESKFGPSGLEYVFLSNNLIENIYTNFNEYKHLKILELTGNPINCSCELWKIDMKLQTIKEVLFGKTITCKNTGKPLHDMKEVCSKKEMHKKDSRLTINHDRFVTNIFKSEQLLNDLDYSSPGSNNLKSLLFTLKQKSKVIDISNKSNKKDLLNRTTTSKITIVEAISLMWTLPKITHIPTEIANFTEISHGYFSTLPLLGNPQFSEVKKTPASVYNNSILSSRTNYLMRVDDISTGNKTSEILPKFIQTAKSEIEETLLSSKIPNKLGKTEISIFGIDSFSVYSIKTKKVSVSSADRNVLSLIRPLNENEFVKTSTEAYLISLTTLIEFETLETSTESYFSQHFVKTSSDYTVSKIGTISPSTIIILMDNTQPFSKEIENERLIKHRLSDLLTNKITLLISYTTDVKNAIGTTTQKISPTDEFTVRVESLISSISKTPVFIDTSNVLYSSDNSTNLVLKKVTDISTKTVPPTDVFINNLNSFALTRLNVPIVEDTSNVVYISDKSTTKDAQIVKITSSKTVTPTKAFTISVNSLPLTYLNTPLLIDSSNVLYSSGKSITTDKMKATATSVKTASSIEAYYTYSDNALLATHLNTPIFIDPSSVVYFSAISTQTTESIILKTVNFSTESITIGVTNDEDFISEKNSSDNSSEHSISGISKNKAISLLTTTGDTRNGLTKSNSLDTFKIEIFQIPSTFASSFFTTINVNGVKQMLTQSYFTDLLTENTHEKSTVMMTIFPLTTLIMTEAQKTYKNFSQIFVKATDYKVSTTDIVFIPPRTVVVTGDINSSSKSIDTKKSIETKLFDLTRNKMTFFTSFTTDYRNVTAISPKTVSTTDTFTNSVNSFSSTHSITPIITPDTSSVLNYSDKSINKNVKKVIATSTVKKFLTDAFIASKNSLTLIKTPKLTPKATDKSNKPNTRRTFLSTTSSEGLVVSETLIRDKTLRVSSFNTDFYKTETTIDKKSSFDHFSITSPIMNVTEDIVTSSVKSANEYLTILYPSDVDSTDKKVPSLSIITEVTKPYISSITSSVINMMEDTNTSFEKSASEYSTMLSPYYISTDENMSLLSITNEITKVLDTSTVAYSIETTSMLSSTINITEASFETLSPKAPKVLPKSSKIYGLTSTKSILKAIDKSKKPITRVTFLPTTSLEELVVSKTLTKDKTSRVSSSDPDFHKTEMTILSNEYANEVVIQTTNKEEFTYDISSITSLIMNVSENTVISSKKNASEYSTIFNPSDISTDENTLLLSTTDEITKVLDTSIVTYSFEISNEITNRSTVLPPNKNLLHSVLVNVAAYEDSSLLLTSTNPSKGLTKLNPSDLSIIKMTSLSSTTIKVTETSSEAPSPKITKVPLKSSQEYGSILPNSTPKLIVKSKKSKTRRTSLSTTSSDGLVVRETSTNKTKFSESPPKSNFPITKMTTPLPPNEILLSHLLIHVVGYDDDVEIENAGGDSTEFHSSFTSSVVTINDGKSPTNKSIAPKGTTGPSKPGKGKGTTSNKFIPKNSTNETDKSKKPRNNVISLVVVWITGFFALAALISLITVLWCETPPSFIRITYVS